MDEGTDGERWPFINDWSFRHYLRLNVAVLVVMVLFLLIKGVYDAIAPLGYLLVPFLVIVPGAGLLKVLRIHNVGMSRSVMYSMGLSLLFIMSMAFLLNLLHYLGAMVNPLTEAPIVIAFLLGNGLIIFGAWKRDVEHIPGSRPKLGGQEMMMIALAIMLPCVAIIGATIANISDDRSIIFYLVLFFCAAPLAIFCRRVKNYDLLILSLSLAILLHRVLITNYLMGYDVFSEYTAARLTSANGWWDMSEYRGMYGAGALTSLGVVGIAPVITSLTSMEMVEMFKIIYPFLFSFMALGVFKAMQSQLGTKAAFLGALLIIGYTAYFSLLSQMAKQDIAELFIIVFLLVVTEKNMDLRHRRLLAFLSVVGVIISHYAMAYLTIGLLGGLLLFNMIILVWKGLHTDGSIVHRLIASMKGWWKAQRNSELVNVQIVAAYLVIFLVWFTFTGSGAMLGFIKYSEAHLSTGSGGTTLATLDALEYYFINYGTDLHNMEKYIVMASQVLCGIGVLYAAFNNKSVFGGKINKDFIILGMLAGILLLMCYSIPKLSAMLYYARFFHFTEIFLAGFLLLGFMAIAHKIMELRGRRFDIHGKRTSQTIMAATTVFLVFFMLFNTSMVYSLAGQYGNSFSLEDSVSWSYYSDQDVQGAKWTSDTLHRDSIVISGDTHHFSVFIGTSTPSKKLYYQWTTNNTDNLVYITSWNNEYRYIYPINSIGARDTYVPLTNVTRQFGSTYDVVYSTGSETTVLYIPYSHPNTNGPGPKIYEYESEPAYVMGVVAIGLLGLVTAAWGVKWLHKRSKS